MTTGVAVRFRRLTTGAGLALAILAAPLAFAGDYPPVSDAAGNVSPSRITAGQCAVFSGDGFNPGVTIAVTDNGQSRGTSTADSTGVFHKKLCYGAQTPAGKHVLKGTGDAPDRPATTSAARAWGSSLLRAPAAEATVLRTVTATLVIEGISQSTPGKEHNPGGVTSLPRTDDGASTGSGLAFTGFPLLLSALAGVLLVGVGSVLLIGAEARHRRRHPRRLA